MKATINVPKELTAEHIAYVESFAKAVADCKEGETLDLCFRYSFERVKDLGLNQDNRKINENHVAKIKKGFAENLEYLSPIIVNIKTNHIVDGQHRHKAFIELCNSGTLDKDKATLPIRIINVDEDTEKQLIIDMNTKSKNWQQKDFVECYSKTDNQYQRLVDWSKEHSITSSMGRDMQEDERPLSFRYAAAIITGRNCSTLIKEGRFAATDEQWENADEMFSDITSIIDHKELELKGAYIESLAIAWHKNKEKIEKDFDDLDDFFHMLAHSDFADMPTSTRKNWEAIFDKASLLYMRNMREQEKSQRSIEMPIPTRMNLPKLTEGITVETD